MLTKRRLIILGFFVLAAIAGFVVYSRTNATAGAPMSGTKLTVDPELVRGNTDFAFKLYQLLAKDKDKPSNFVFSSYSIAQLMAMLRRRSLVILLTDVLDATASAGLIHNLARAAERHVVMCVVLTEPLIGAIAHSVPATVEETYRKAAACDQVRRRSLALENMRSRGILVLETDPARLSVHLVQRYLVIRQADLQ